jgi:hypothetical protein
MTTTKPESTVALIKAEINRELADPETMKSLLEVTFKGLEAPVMKRALLEGRMRGFEFKDFLEKKVYAIPYSGSYSLVASIDHFRKVGSRAGVVGVKKPEFVMEVDGKRPVSCSVTVQKRFADGYIGDFTAEVDFTEYSTGKNLWTSKPKTMIAKVAEMHALRKACPEELAQVYVEEEFEKREEPIKIPAINLDALRPMLKECKTIEELDRAWADIPGDAKGALMAEMQDMRAMINSAANDA